MSHEMKTPLTIIAAGIQLAEGYVDKENSVEAKKIMREAWQETMQLADNVTGALSFARSQELSDTMQYVDFSAVIEATLKVFEPLIKKQGNTLTFKIEKLPPIKGNADMLTSALINLLTNANRSTTEGSIHVLWHDINNKYCLQVTDTGTGIEPGILPHIFERGISGTNSTGLGLAIVKNIMQSHNGEVLIESEVDKGTIVKLLFPKEHRTEAQRRGEHGGNNE
jgi:signal transduction histidine kinase